MTHQSLAHHSQIDLSPTTFSPTRRLRSFLSGATIALFLLATTCGAARSAQAGQWVVKECIRNGATQNQSFGLGYNEETDENDQIHEQLACGSYVATTNLHTTANYQGPGYIPSTRAYDFYGPSSNFPTHIVHDKQFVQEGLPANDYPLSNMAHLSFCPPEQVMGNWPFASPPPQLTDGAQPGHASDSLSITPLLVWKPRQISVNGYYVDDPTDVPPALTYFMEEASIDGYESFSSGTDSSPIPWNGNDPYHKVDFEYSSLQCPFTTTDPAQQTDPSDNSDHTDEAFRIAGVNSGFGYCSTHLRMGGTNVYLLKNPSHLTIVLGPTRHFQGSIALHSAFFKDDYVGKSGSASLTCNYNITPLILDLTATPVGPYKVVKDTPFSKEYNGTTRWGIKLTDDDGAFSVPAPPDPGTPATDNTKVIHGQYTIDAGSSFVAIGKRPDGTDIFPNQKYIWKVDPEPYIAPPLNFTVDSQPDIIVWKSELNAKDYIASTILHEMGPEAGLGDIIQYIRNGGYLDPESGAIMSPELRDNLFRHLEAAWRGSHPPDEEQVDKSTPTKDFTWNEGDASTYKNFAAKSKPSVVRAFVTGQNDTDPIIPVGKVKINWSRPKKAVWQITISPVTWHVPQGEGFLDLVRSVFSSNEALTEHLELDGGMKLGQIAISMVGGGGEANAARTTVVELTTSSDVSGSELARLFAEEGKLAAPESAAGDPAIPDTATGEFGVEAKQKGDLPEGENPEPPTQEKTTVEFKSNCFVAGTPVLMGDGTLKPIEQVQTGDTVESKDPATGRVHIKKVLRTFRNIAPVILSLTLGNGERLTTTPGHPFATTQHGNFVLAARLPLKTQLPEFNGHFVPLVSETALTQTTPIYNFEVQDFHTYFVGKSHLWVHNQSRLDQFSQKIQDDVAIARLLREELPAKWENSAGEKTYKTSGKTPDMSEADESMIEGYKGRDNNRWTTNALRRADAMGHSFKSSGNEPEIGIRNASHTEIKLRERLIDKGLDPTLPITVNNTTCPSCRENFHYSAIADNRTYTVADPFVVRIFKPKIPGVSDGEILVVHNDNSVTTYKAGTSAFTWK